MIQLAKEKTHEVNFHTPTYIGSLRKVGKYAKALNTKATEQLETCNKDKTHAQFTKARTIIHIPAGSIDKMVPVTNE